MDIETVLDFRGFAAANDLIGKTDDATRATRIVAVGLVDLRLQHRPHVRVSTQITGKPASASALNSHCDSGPASNQFA